MKEMTYDEKITKCAKTLIKEFKEHLKDENYEDNTSIHITSRFTSVTRNGVRDVVFDCGDNGGYRTYLNIPFGDLSDEGFASVTCSIATKIQSLLKMPKKYRMFVDEEKKTSWGTWTSHDYYLTYGLLYVKPCKEFDVINKKLVHLGCKEIPFEKWWYGDAGGKRGNCSVGNKKYYAADKTMCDKVLAYLKGKKKVSYELVDDNDFSDMERGIRYETEWYGSASNKLKFTDSKGQSHIIY